VPHALAIALLATLVLALVAPPAGAQLYRWVNERGEVHMTEGLASVPEAFRRGAVPVGRPDLPRPDPRAVPVTPAREATELARIPFVPGAPIMVMVRINGGRNVRLMLDTGASHTVISPQALIALGIDASAGGNVSIKGVTGSAEARHTLLESVEVGDARVAPLEVLVHDANLFQGEGLLGRDFLDRFSVTIDTRAREVILARR
jgi:clan AA aspartic protease (TIGR02281 family)